MTVPMMPDLRLRRLVRFTLLNPKSVIFTTQSRFTSTLLLFKSQWMIGYGLCWWR